MPQHAYSTVMFPAMAAVVVTAAVAAVMAVGVEEGAVAGVLHVIAIVLFCGMVGTLAAR